MALKAQPLAFPVKAPPQLNYRQRPLELRTLEEEVEAHTQHKIYMKITHLCPAEEVVKVL
jgi:hypothetical protein